MKVLLDTNIWISGLLWGGNPRKILQLAQHEQIVIYSSKALVNELQATLAYPKLQRRLEKLEITAEELVAEVCRIIQVCEPISRLSIPELRDLKDKIVLETALSVPVEVIITGDEDLLVLGQFHDILILTTAQFLEGYQFG